MYKRKQIYLVVGFFLAGLFFLNLSAGQRQSNDSIFDPLVDVVDLIHKYYVTESDDATLVNGAINGTLGQLDPYSEFIPARDLEEFNKQASGFYHGIGIQIDIKDGYLTVVSPFEDSPAYKAGIRPGDKIIEVNGKITKGWSTTKAVQELSGPNGTTTTIKVVHLDGSSETLSIVRQEVIVPTVRGWRQTEDGTWDYLLDKKNKIGYARITQFVSDTAEQLDRAVNQLTRQDMKGLVIDLRANPGGLMSSALATADRFLEQGVIVSTRGANSAPTSQSAHPENTYPNFPLVLLVDQGSASASEIVAGALQDHNRAVIVGKRSWGKGSVQRPIRLPDSGAVLKLTTDYYYLPNGRCVHRQPNAELWGVDPDIDQDYDPADPQELRDLMRYLTLPPALQSTSEEAPDFAGLPPEALAKRLKDLDTQLDQAVKQSIGLVRAQPTLQGLGQGVIKK